MFVHLMWNPNFRQAVVKNRQAAVASVWSALMDVSPIFLVSRRCKTVQFGNMGGRGWDELREREGHEHDTNTNHASMHSRSPKASPTTAARKTARAPSGSGCFKAYHVHAPMPNLSQEWPKVDSFKTYRVENSWYVALSSLQPLQSWHTTATLI